ncbi:MAG: hypothetical protein PHX08_14210 [Lachnospiraceae bacterium]|nr:hypothetical protein [Lachnospiraceae bacterium]
MDFAMILNGIVIEVIKNVDIMPIYPPTLTGDIVTPVDCTGVVVTVGTTYADGVFTAIEPEPEPQEASLSETEQAIMQTAINTEYMAALMETTI